MSYNSKYTGKQVEERLDKVDKIDELTDKVDDIDELTDKVGKLSEKVDGLENNAITWIEIQ